MTLMPSEQAGVTRPSLAVMVGAVLLCCRWASGLASSPAAVSCLSRSSRSAPIATIEHEGGVNRNQYATYSAR